jgi:hypothetical protein
VTTRIKLVLFSSADSTHAQPPLAKRQQHPNPPWGDTRQKRDAQTQAELIFLSGLS